MKKIAMLICIFAILIPLNLFALTVTLTWNKSISSTPKTIDHYNVYQATATGMYPSTPTLKVPYVSTSATISNLAVKNYYWVVTAVDSAGKESARSVEVTTKWYVILLNSYKNTPAFMIYWDTN